MNPIVGIHSFRHGTGTSTLTAYLALTLAHQGRRVVAIEVQCPGTVQTGEVSLPNYLNVGTPLGGFEALINPEDYRAIAVSSNLGIPAPGRIHVVRFPAAIAQHWTLDSCSQLLAKICQELEVDDCLLDLPAGMNEFVLMMFGILDTLLVILCPDQMDFQCTAVTTDVAKRLQIPRIGIALNQVPDVFEPVSLQSQLEELYQLPLMGHLPFAGEIRLGLPYQTFANLKTRDPFRGALEQIAQRLQSLDQHPPQPRPGVRSLANSPTLIDILMLPDAERQLTNWLIYHGRVQAEDVAQHLGASLSITLGILERLLNQGIIETLTEEGKTYYRSRVKPPK